MFGWREVFITFNADDYVSSKQLLHDNGIEFKVIAKNTTNQFYNGVIMRSEHDVYGRSYQIFVKKQDFQLARHILGRV